MSDVAISLERKAVLVTWDSTLVQGDEVDIRFERGEDFSTRHTLNDGDAVATYPYDFTGTTHVTITGSEGGVVEGDISV